MSASKMAFVSLHNNVKVQMSILFYRIFVNEIVAKATINLISFGLRCVLITFVMVRSEL